MIYFNKASVPYILGGSSLACMSFVSFFKAANSFVRLYNRVDTCCKHTQNYTKLQRRYKEVFFACAWLGFFALSTYYCYRVSEDFLAVSTFGDNSDLLNPYAEDIRSYQEKYNSTFLETDSLRNFCLASVESTLAHKSLVSEETPSRYWVKSDPRLDTARLALNMVDEFKYDAKLLREGIAEKEKIAQSNFLLFQKKLTRIPVGKGVEMDFSKFCSSPFRFLKPSICSNYLGFQSHLKTYAQLKIKADRYGDMWLSSHQQMRCKDVFGFKINFDQILSREHLDELEDSRRGFLGRIFNQVNPF